VVKFVLAFLVPSVAHCMRTGTHPFLQEHYHGMIYLANGGINERHTY
jgi:hypothetical protein